ncbi:MAG: ATP-dependent zinc protease [Flavobacteriia bacterium]|nr:ATP-dependent zinc protease [Flavobacteriia bacterium]
MAKKQKVTIGRVDEINLPEFGLESLSSKIDTGAALSAIHCHSIKVVEKDGHEELWFKLLDKKHPGYQNKYYKTTDFRERKIRNSFGQEQMRYSITTNVNVFGMTFPCEFTLADRDKMNYPCLIGRNMLKGRFIVDVTKKNLSVKKEN